MTETATRLSAERLAEIEATATAEGLTEGPWQPLYEGCDCGGDYGCGHGEYVWAIHTPALTPFWATRKMPGGEVPSSAYDRSELADFTSADLELIAEARTAIPEMLAEIKRLYALQEETAQRLVGIVRARTEGETAR